MMAVDPAANHSHEINNFTPLRLLLASLVMLTHFKALTGVSANIWPMIYPDFAVNSFYVVSGFLIYESFDRKPDLSSFYIRRLFRLYPLYLFVVIVQTILLLCLQSGSVIAHLHEAGLYFAANAAFLNFIKNSIGDAMAGSHNVGINPSLWTLKVEVAFYLLVPLIWLGVKRFGWRWLVAAFFASLLYTTVMRTTGHETLANQIPGALMYFISGILLRFYFRFVRVSTPVVFAVALIAFALVTCIQVGAAGFINESLRVLFPFLIVPIVYAVAFRLPPLHMKRDFSYGVYLIHGPLIQTLFVLSLIQFSLSSLLVVIVTVLILALFVERFIERPFIEIGRLLSKRVTLGRSERPA